MPKRHMKYNPSFLSDAELMESFVVRHEDLDLITRIIDENRADSNQHVLVIGPRGSGKTTLVHRVSVEIKRNKELRTRWYPLIFSEESYEVVSAGEFWLEALFHLSEQTNDEKWKKTYDELKAEADDQRLFERALSQLLDFADSQGKRILLIVENLNMLLGDMMGLDEAWKMRHTLMNEPRMMLLATATNRFEQIENSSHAMFEMFKMQELKPLDDDECNRIWEFVAGERLSGERIKPIRILTGGNPRLLTIIAKFGAHRSFRKLLDDLVHLIDDHTEYFKSHLDNLPAIERKAYLALAGLWDASTAREVAKAARLDVNKTSSLLRRLIGRGAVVVEDKGKKVKWYSVAERMYNIYYLMRRRGKPSDRVKATVKFMISMYDPESVARLIAEEAIGLSPDICIDHYMAYEETIKEVSNCQLLDKIVASTPTLFLESPHINETLKEMMAVDGKQASKDVENGTELGEFEESLESVKLGLQLFENKKYEQGVKAIDRVLKKNIGPDKLSGKLLMATALNAKVIGFLGLSKWEEAISICDKMISHFEGAEEPELSYALAFAMLSKAEALQQLKCFEEAIGIYGEVIAGFADAQEKALSTLLARAMVRLGKKLAKLKRHEEAIAIYEKAIERFERDEDFAQPVLTALVGKGFALSELKRHEEAISVCDDLIGRLSDSDNVIIRELKSDVLKVKALSLSFLKKFEKAETTIREAIELEPGDNEAVLYLIDFLLKVPERLDEALKTAEELVKHKPNDADLLNDIPRLFYEHGDLSLLKKAEKWSRKAASLEPENTSIQLTLACILSVLGKGEEALESAEKYIQDASLVERAIEDAIELFVALAAAGYAKEALGLLVHSPSRKHLEPLEVGLKLFIGEDVKTAPEIREIAKDVVKRIESRTKEG